MKKTNKNKVEINELVNGQYTNKWKNFKKNNTDNSSSKTDQEKNE